MDVKEVKSVKDVVHTRQGFSENQRNTSQRSAQELSADKINLAATEFVKVEISSKNNSVQRSRDKANAAINLLNVVSDAAEEIDKLVASLSGIAEQASKTNLSDSRRAILDKEAQELIQAITKRSEIEASPGLHPLKGDPIKVEIEEENGRTLEVNLPDISPQRLGIKDISLMPGEQIESTREAIDQARSQLEELKGTVEESRENVSRAITEADIANANREAAESTVRDVDLALELTGGIQNLIAETPKTAIKASAVSANSLRFLND